MPPLWRVARIDVRVHIAFLLLVAYQLIRAALPAANDSSVRLPLGWTAITLTVLFVVVLLHEYGHCVACRRRGGVADEILMWPLGGLASCEPPQDWRAHLWTALGGPMVNVLILAVTTPLVGVLTGKWIGTAFPDPLHFAPPIQVLERMDLFAVFAVHWIALVLLLFNLLPIFPLDGGRILQAVLWPRVGYTRAMRFSCRAGFVGAILLGTLGAVTTELSLIGVAIFGALTCYVTLKRLEFTEEQLGFEDTEGDAYLASSGREAPDERREREIEEARIAREQTTRERDVAKRAREEAEFDQILDKIRGSGLNSLSSAERRVLERETERRRRGG